MKRFLAIALLSLLTVPYGFGAGWGGLKSALILDVYSEHIQSDVTAEKGFALWAEALKQPGESSHERSPVIHAVYRLDGAFNIQKHYTTGEGSEGEITVVAHAEPSGDSGEVDVKFSELGRPPAYEGKTELTIRPKEKRVLVLPEIELGPGEKLATVVTLEYRVEDKENGLRSRFEIN